jgi:hypothetical protein
MDELDDHIRDQDEMNDMFSRPIGQDAYTTDADLESGRKISFTFFQISILFKNWLVLLNKNFIQRQLPSLIVSTPRVFLFNPLIPEAPLHKSVFLIFLFKI